MNNNPFAYTSPPLTPTGDVMDQEKSALQSTTIWAVLAMFASGIGNKFGVSITEATLHDLVAWATDASFLISTAVAIYGRIKATHVIASIVPPAVTKTLPMLLAALLVATTAIGCSSIDDTYVAADRATFKAIAPTYRGILDGTVPLSEIDADERDSINLTLDTWDQRIKAHESAATQPAEAGN